MPGKSIYWGFGEVKFQGLFSPSTHACKVEGRQRA